MHELGHFETARLFGFNVDKIYLYPTGGISKFSTEMNVSLFKDFLVLINGPLVQCIVYFLIMKFYPYHNSLFFLKNIHYSIICFNMLPIYPLDGGKLLNIIFNYFFSFKVSFKISIFISYILLFLFSLVLFDYFKINYVFMILFLLFKVTIENYNSVYYFERFLLERYLYNYPFCKVKIINSLDQMKREYTHIVGENNNFCYEKEALNRKYLNKNKDFCGRAPRLHRGGQRFDPAMLHH